MKKDLAFIILLLIPSAKLAAESPTVTHKEQYLRIIEQAETSPKQGLYFKACRAALELGGTMQKGDNAVKTLHKAITFCSLALKENPDSFDAGASLAVALSYEGKRLQKTSYAKSAKKLLIHFSNKFPNLSYAQAAYAAWHSEVSAAGMFARIALGGSRKTAEKLFEKANLGTPLDVSFKLEYVKFLARGNKEQRTKALELVKLISETQTSTPFKEYFIKKAQSLQKALVKGKKGAIKKAAKQASIFNGIEDWDTLPPYVVDPWVDSFIAEISS